mgnify:FL=1|jgi:hypothetical protein|tara:strand:+ start:1151 stop:1330 length:180 start_codon:yes stop_codon:yes gene_type:complete
MNSNDYLGYYAKDKFGNLFQFEWGEDDNLYIRTFKVNLLKVNKEEYEIVNIKIVTEEEE